jgi:Janus kinase 2
MRYLHGKNVIHRDLAARNLLVARQKGNNDISIKISDFGLGKIMSDEEYYSENTELLLPLR